MMREKRVAFVCACALFLVGALQGCHGNPSSQGPGGGLIIPDGTPIVTPALPDSLTVEYDSNGYGLKFNATASAEGHATVYRANAIVPVQMDPHVKLQLELPRASILLRAESVQATVRDGVPIQATDLHFNSAEFVATPTSGPIEQVWIEGLSGLLSADGGHSVTLRFKVSLANAQPVVFELSLATPPSHLAVSQHSPAEFRTAHPDMPWPSSVELDGDTSARILEVLAIENQESSGVVIQAGGILREAQVINVTRTVSYPTSECSYSFQAQDRPRTLANGLYLVPLASLSGQASIESQEKWSLPVAAYGHLLLAVIARGGDLSDEVDHGYAMSSLHPVQVPERCGHVCPGEERDSSLPACETCKAQPPGQISEACEECYNSDSQTCLSWESCSAENRSRLFCSVEWKHEKQWITLQSGVMDTMTLVKGLQLADPIQATWGGATPGSVNGRAVSTGDEIQLKP